MIIEMIPFSTQSIISLNMLDIPERKKSGPPDILVKNIISSIENLIKTAHNNREGEYGG